MDRQLSIHLKYNEPVHVKEKYARHLLKSTYIYTFIQDLMNRLPSWLNGEESACQCRRQGFHPWSRRIPHAVEQLSPQATATEAHMPYGLCSMEATTMRSLSTATREQSPFAASREKLSRNEDSTQPKKKKILLLSLCYSIPSSPGKP